ncbi:LuxR C-terminal-related transcriptional regulator [Streptomyces sp. NBC_01201]|uniref:LuxR C-terminal-related transcriptional regulator n=1 Tax=unclassified Streptomyces TaxID=2593676 RepID=UPI002E1566C0|nr:LuxR C-terminal-related transcriptional regulator [Streptomyces sp. NBC_01201]
MTAPTIATIELAPRERQVLEGLSDGSTLATVALNLKIREGTARGYLKLAKRKLHGASENATALAIAYATNAITCPALLDPEGLFLTREQRDLIPLIGRGMPAGTMASELKRPVAIVRRDGRDLLTNLGATNPAHAIRRAWQYQALTADQVIAWLR